MKLLVLLLFIFSGMVNAAIKNELLHLKTKLDTLNNALSRSKNSLTSKQEKPVIDVYNEASDLQKKLIGEISDTAVYVLDEKNPIFKEWKKQLNFSADDYLCLHNKFIHLQSPLIKGTGIWKDNRALNGAYLNKQFFYITQEYKIHLMPRSAEDLETIVKGIIEELRTNSVLQNCISGIRFKMPQYNEPLEPQLMTEKNEILPIVVIYPIAGKDNAQYVLDTVYKLFGTMEGLDIPPRYNAQITSLIYYAQGDGSSKSRYPKYFTEDKIFFKPDIEGKGYNIDYHLDNPAQK